MSSDLSLALGAFGIGIVAGLRSMMAPAVVSWATHFHSLNLRDSRLAFFESTVAGYAFFVLAMGELIADKLPFTPNRTRPLSIAFRILSGATCGAALCIAANRVIVEGAVLGGLGALNGAFGGFHVRRLIVKHLKISQMAVALAEDAIAIGLGFFIVTRF